MQIPECSVVDLDQEKREGRAGIACGRQKSADLVLADAG
jgi:hypothetical protein